MSEAANEYSVWIRRSGDRIDRVWEYLDVAEATRQLSADVSESSS